MKKSTVLIIIGLASGGVMMYAFHLTITTGDWYYLLGAGISIVVMRIVGIIYKRLPEAEKIVIEKTSLEEQDKRRKEQWEIAIFFICVIAMVIGDRVWRDKTLILEYKGIGLITALLAIGGIIRSIRVLSKL